MLLCDKEKSRKNKLASKLGIQFQINFLGAKSRIELDLSSNLFVSEAKEARKQLRLKYETRAVHIAAEQVITIFHISNVF